MSTVDLQIKCDIMTPNVSEMYRNVEHLGCVGTKGGSDFAGSYGGGKKQILILFLIKEIKLKMSALCACWGELSIPAAPALPGKWDGEGTLENLEFGEEAPLNKTGDSRHFLYREQDSSVKLCCAELSNDAQVTPGGAFVCVL